MRVQISLNGRNHNWSESTVCTKLKLANEIKNRPKPQNLFLVDRICEIFKTTFLKINFWFTFRNKDNVIKILDQLKQVSFWNPRTLAIYEKCCRSYQTPILANNSHVVLPQAQNEIESLKSKKEKIVNKLTNDVDINTLMVELSYYKLELLLLKRKTLTMPYNKQLYTEFQEFNSFLSDAVDKRNNLFKKLKHNSDANDINIIKNLINKLRTRVSKNALLIQSSTPLMD